MCYSINIGSALYQLSANGKAFANLSLLASINLEASSGLSFLNALISATILDHLQ
jgi:hypothetical protein